MFNEFVLHLPNDPQKAAYLLEGYLNSNRQNQVTAHSWLDNFKSTNNPQNVFDALECPKDSSR